jgi:hypothetical protein
MNNQFVLAMDLAENDSVYFTPDLYQGGGQYASYTAEEGEDFCRHLLAAPRATQCGTEWD